jgi:hypothetical protein
MFDIFGAALKSAWVNVIGLNLNNIISDHKNNIKKLNPVAHDHI